LTAPWVNTTLKFVKALACFVLLASLPTLLAKSLANLASLANIKVRRVSPHASTAAKELSAPDPKPPCVLIALLAPSPLQLAYLIVPLA